MIISFSGPQIEVLYRTIIRILSGCQLTAIERAIYFIDEMVNDANTEDDKEILNNRILDIIDDIFPEDAKTALVTSIKFTDAIRDYCSSAMTASYRYLAFANGLQMAADRRYASAYTAIDPQWVAQNRSNHNFNQGK